MTLNTRLYLWTNPTGPVFAVASLSGIKANPAMYSEMERVNSYVDAFKEWFPKKVRGKDAVAKLTLVGPKTLNGHAGREYRITIGDLSGSAHVYATRRRFYAAVILNTKKDDALTDRFLSSFFLPDKSNRSSLQPSPRKRRKPKQNPKSLIRDRISRDKNRTNRKRKLRVPVQTDQPRLPPRARTHR